MRKLKMKSRALSTCLALPLLAGIFLNSCGQSEYTVNLTRTTAQEIFFPVKQFPLGIQSLLLILLYGMAMYFWAGFRMLV